MKKILIVDGNSILNRAFYGVPPLTTKDGLHTNAVYGMLNILLSRVESLRPDYMAVTFDLPVPTFRHKAYELYKANRHPAPDELREQFPYIKECLAAMGIRTVEVEGYEADDLQGTLAMLAHGDPDLHAYILTGDRDLLQLIDDSISVLLVGSKETLLYDTALFTEKYGFPPRGLIEAKALMGDSSDNIPGVAGVGEKTAQKLIAEFGTLDAVYEGIDSPSIAKGVREKLLRDRDAAYLSRMLATICTEAPLPCTLEELAFHGIPCDGEEFYNTLMKYGLVKLIARLGLQAACRVPEHCTACSSPAVAYGDCNAAEVLALPPSPIALALTEDGIALATKEAHLLYRGALTDIAPLFARSEPLVVYDAKSLYHTLRREGIRPAVPPFDVMLAAYVDNPQGTQPTLEGIVSTYLLHDLPKDEPTAHELLALRELLTDRLREAGSLSLLLEIELPLVPVLADMEAAGFAVDREGLAEFDSTLERAVAADAETILQLAGEDFNVNSTKQLGEVLFDHLGIPYPKRRKAGAPYSTDAEILEAVRYHHPIVDAILEYRQLAKFRSTYTQGLLRAAGADGRVHSEFRQALTSTGRLSSTEPNLQNIPVRTELGRQFRRYFKASGEGRVLIDADYSQIELRLLAHASGDETMIAAYREGADIHTRTAARAFGVPEEAVTPDLRKRAKAVSFGIVYGISSFSLSADLGITVKEADAYIADYFAQFPRVKDYLDGVIAAAKEDGYTTTLFGRRRYIPELTSPQYMVRKMGERKAMNSPLQGTAADVIKRAMIAVDRRLREEGLDARLILQVHDELIVEASLADAQRARAILRQEMEGAAALNVPLTVDISVGSTWL